MDGQGLAPAPMVMSERQLSDFAWLLGRFLTPDMIRYVANQVLGSGAITQSGTSEQLARIAVQELQSQGRIADAVALLEHEGAGSNARLMLGLNHIRNNFPLNSEETLQAFLNEYEPFLKSNIIETVLPKILRAVCAVAVNTPPNPRIRGSGFLVGPDLVMTNFHVVWDLLTVNNQVITPKPGVTGDNIYCFFDYLNEPAPNVPPDTIAGRTSVSVQADRNWLVFARPPLPNDGKPEAGSQVATELDYAVIRLKKRIGEVPARRSGGPKRGWLPLPDSVEVLNIDRKVMVFQHPQRAPQRWDVGPYKEIDPSGTRLRYEVSTAHGSSGGATVDTEGRLFALHNAEVQPAPPFPAKRQNQGVRIDRIAQDLRVHVPGLLVDIPEEDDSRLFWSLSDNIQNPQPIIGRAEFREKVAAMMRQDGVRVITVTGPAASGLRFSTKILRRTIALHFPIVRFEPVDLETMGPGRFVRQLLDDLEVQIPDDDPFPEPQNTEALARWVRLDLPPWLSRVLEKDERSLLEKLTPETLAQTSRRRYPAWVVLNTAVWNPDGQARRLLWADKLRDLVAALLGVHDPGQASVDIPQLRWLLLAPSADLLPLRDVTRLDDELSPEASYQEYQEDFADCMAWAWRAVQPRDEAGPDLFKRIAGRYKRHHEMLGRNITLRKFLAENVAEMIREQLQTGRGQ